MTEAGTDAASPDQQANARRLGWAALAIALLVAAILAYLLADAVIDKGVSWPARLFLAILGPIALLAAIVASDRFPVDPTDVRAWLTPRTTAGLLVAVFATFGVLSGVYDLYSPRGARSDELAQVRAEQQAAFERLGASRTSEQSALLERLEGIWGTINCTDRLVVAVSDDQRLLSMDFGDYQSTARITGFGDNVIFLTQRTPAAGHRVVLTLGDGQLTVTQPTETVGGDAATSFLECD